MHRRVSATERLSCRLSKPPPNRHSLNRIHLWDSYDRRRPFRALSNLQIRESRLLHLPPTRTRSTLPPRSENGNAGPHSPGKHH